ncbi:MAG: hypothetical protein SGJ02_08405 [bacterium]|nr:hypothetical protein [bacterium]
MKKKEPLSFFKMADREKRWCEQCQNYVTAPLFGVGKDGQSKNFCVDCGQETVLFSSRDKELFFSIGRQAKPVGGRPPKIRDMATQS